MSKKLRQSFIENGILYIPLGNGGNAKADPELLDAVKDLFWREDKVNGVTKSIRSGSKTQARLVLHHLIIGKPTNYQSLHFANGDIYDYRASNISYVLQRRGKQSYRADGDVCYVNLGDCEALCDSIDTDVITKRQWYKCSHGYARTTMIKRKYRMHQLIMGTPPEGFCVDHINRNRLDNRRCNLRFVPSGTNVINRGLMSRNTSGYIGVSFVPRVKSKPWRAQITDKGINRHIGYYATKEEAKLAYDVENIKLNGLLANLDQ